jgi:hypothetical protein
MYYRSGLRNCTISPAAIVQWIKECHVVETLFGRFAHVELIRRSTDIVKLLAEDGSLTTDMIELIWSTTVGSHETVQQAVYTLIADIAFHLSGELWDYVDAKIAAIPLRQLLNPNLFSLLRSFVQTAIDRTAETIDPTVAGRKFACVDVLWRLCMDDSPASLEQGAQALQSLCELLQHSDCSKLRK